MVVVVLLLLKVEVVVVVLVLVLQRMKIRVERVIHPLEQVHGIRVDMHSHTRFTTYPATNLLQCIGYITLQDLCPFRRCR